jgi:molybdopterin-guanine dinucleotide biosynthesis protein A
MTRFPDIEAFVLVGGRSSRMGRDKALLELAGKPVLQRTADLLTPLVAGITLVTSAASASSADSGNPPNPIDGLKRYARFGWPTCADRWADAGPLGGIATALTCATTTWCLFLACDLPYLTEDWLIFLLAKTGESAADLIIPENVRGLEPLCAVYRSANAAVLAAALESGVRKVTDAFEKLRVERVPENEWRKFSPDGSLFHNMNTWQDYLDARQYLKS